MTSRSATPMRLAAPHRKPPMAGFVRRVPGAGCTRAALAVTASPGRILERELDRSGDAGGALSFGWNGWNDGPFAEKCVPHERERAP